MVRSFTLPEASEPSDLEFVDYFLIVTYKSQFLRPFSGVILNMLMSAGPPKIRSVRVRSSIAIVH